MHLFYTPDITSDNYIFDAEESKHCIRVLRLSLNDIVFLTDGKGRLYEAEIIDDNMKACKVKVLNITDEFRKRKYKIHLAVAPTKNLNRMEWFIEKATEIGIDEFTPLICEHSEKTYFKAERMSKICISAMKQSLQTYLPVLNDPAKFTEFVSQFSFSEKYICWCETDTTSSLKNIYQQGKDVIILIGPEGDFSKDEISQAIQHGFVPVSLGLNRLRTETAALAACHTINLLNL